MATDKSAIKVQITDVCCTYHWFGGKPNQDCAKYPPNGKPMVLRRALLAWEVA